MSIEFGVLGPLEARAGRIPINLGGRRQQRLLAALLLNAQVHARLADLTHPVALAAGADPE